MSIAVLAPYVHVERTGRAWYHMPEKNYTLNHLSTRELSIEAIVLDFFTLCLHATLAQLRSVRERFTTNPVELDHLWQ
jgi:hypothetical protein